MVDRAVPHWLLLLPVCTQSGALVLSALGLPDYISMVQAGPGSVARGPDALPLGGKMRDVHGRIREWVGGQASVMLFLTWSALVRLLEQLLDQMPDLGGERGSGCGCGIANLSALQNDTLAGPVLALAVSVPHVMTASTPSSPC